MRMVECKACGQKLDVATNKISDERTPCPYCGSKSQLIKITLEGTLKPHRISFRLRAKQNGRGKPVNDLKIYDDPSKETGRMMFVKRIVNRRNNYYFEEVIDVESKQIIHKCEEPLSKHTGHGSAKRNK